MNTFILDVVLLSTYFKDTHDQIYSDLTDPNLVRASSVPERNVSSTRRHLKRGLTAKDP